MEGRGGGRGAWGGGPEPLSEPPGSPRLPPMQEATTPRAPSRLQQQQQQTKLQRPVRAAGPAGSLRQPGRSQSGAEARGSGRGALQPAVAQRAGSAASRLDLASSGRAPPRRPGTRLTCRAAAPGLIREGRPKQAAVVASPAGRRKMQVGAPPPSKRVPGFHGRGPRVAAAGGCAAVSGAKLGREMKLFPRPSPRSHVALSPGNATRVGTAGRGGEGRAGVGEGLLWLCFLRGASLWECARREVWKVRGVGASFRYGGVAVRSGCIGGTRSRSGKLRCVCKSRSCSHFSQARLNLCTFV